MKNLKVVFAHGNNGEFSLNGDLPWGKPLSHDMVAFRKFTQDAVVVMGRKTFESLPFSLPHRTNVVISTTHDECRAKNGDPCHLVEVPKEYARIGNDDYNDGVYNCLVSLRNSYPNIPIVVIGGAKLIEEVIPYAEEVMVTHVHMDCLEADRIAYTTDDLKNLPCTYFDGKMMKLEIQRSALHIDYSLEPTEPNCEISHYKMMEV